MKEITLNKPFVNEEEYFLFEEKSELKHEYINSTLYEMSGASIIHNRIERRVSILIENLLKAVFAFEIFTEGVKVRTPEGGFFYPDIIICEPGPEKYYRDKPILLVEILSESTKTFDLADKFIQYRKFPTLAYYLCIEPEYPMVYVYYRTPDNEWRVDTYTSMNDTINLPMLGISFLVKDIYQS